MARIEFQVVEQKMDDLRGYYKGFANPDKNPYRASELNDDEFNFCSGINYALSYITDLFLANDEELETGYEEIDKAVKEITRRAIEEYAQWGYRDLEQIMTSFIDDHGWDEEESKDE